MRRHAFMSCYLGVGLLVAGLLVGRAGFAFLNSDLTPAGKSGLGFWPLAPFGAANRPGPRRGPAGGGISPASLGPI